MRFAPLILLPFAAVWLTSCGGNDTTNNTEDNLDPAVVYTPYVSDVPRETSPLVTDEDFAQLVEGNNRFALKVFHKLLEENSNSSVFSPFSVSSALAMAYAGAAGETKAEMAGTLEFTLIDDALHPGFNKLATELAKRNLPAEPWANAQELLINNAVWPYTATPPAESFLDTLARHYGSGIYGLDYVNEPELSRKTINDQVEEWTKGYITDLLPGGSITRDTRMVLTSAIYLHAPWDSTFPSSSAPKPFYNLDGSIAEVPTMGHQLTFAYTELEGAKLAALPFRDWHLFMAFLIPDDFSTYVANLDAETLRDGLAQMESYSRSYISLPKFQVEQEISMKKLLKELGMVQAFGQADFSEMGLGNVQIGDVNHKAFIDVNQAGTTAAAATAVRFPQPSAAPPPVRMEINKPFVFLIYDHETKTILFLGHVANL